MQIAVALADAAPTMSDLTAVVLTGASGSFLAAIVRRLKRSALAVLTATDEVVFAVGVDVAVAVAFVAGVGDCAAAVVGAFATHFRPRVFEEHDEHYELQW